MTDNRSKRKPTLYWTVIQHDGWNLHLAATEDGLSYVGSNGQPFEEMAQWAASRMPGSELVHDVVKLQPYEKELMEYIDGQRREFSLPLDCQGTPFQTAVWEALCRIPYGSTASYSDIALQLNKPSAVRAVGSAIGANPVLITVPCHRVIGKNGTLTGYRGGLPMKTALLQLERAGESAYDEDRI
ncbi:methylated-DNA--[protein]-cysteine S-methyltransferase [Paenibacillus kobensis]|uniref:methylated-DNA--[protein]-cysteine S-methyltransferase n=1 Tax=Paenibacillus kobensis TaxID=59841 RepID=UPI000FD8304A|nr:methylated-DNA--[protein]-cysteine S-methyltransferase [Paenibacillus kobensis]